MSSDKLRSMMFKLVLIGDASVGKTSIRRRYMGSGFVAQHLATIGVDFAQKYVKVNDNTIRLVIWDLAGQEAYEKIRSYYYQGCSAVILVYSVVDRRSFDNASKWLVEAHKYIGSLPPSVVVGNKIDLREQKSRHDIVTTDEGKKFASVFSDRMNIPVLFKETSALTGENIEDAFCDLTNLMIEVYKERKEKLK
ncbi:MAG: GTP-binding protein [Candidatus Lokiarchaeota archaeon]|nr:GTP-binding protein [Candidatus Lokiarchaeota archaeon]